MRLISINLIAGALLAGGVNGFAAITPEQAAQLPPTVKRAVSFSNEIKPIFEASCIKCHGRGRVKGGFRLDTRETLLKGGDSGPAIVPGNSAESLLIALVQGVDPDNIMPKKGSRLTADQIGLLRGWIDQGAPWEAGVTFGRLEPMNLKTPVPEIPAGSKNANPIDRFLQPYFAEHKIKPAPVVSDRVFARRAYLDIAGLLPPPNELEVFVTDHRSDKRERLVDRLLADDRNYAEHWLTFWNDMLRNDYKGTGYIDGGRKQITKWLYSALLTNMPYNQFVAELIAPHGESEGFTKGIVWRGAVNASQTPQMQAAQNISQVFMGVNLKCASCHDSFINDLTLADAYGLAGIYADAPLEMVHCDKPTGQKAELKFIYPELGALEPTTNRATRLQELAHLITQPKDGRLTRTLVNRIWQRLSGHGLVEPVDDMEKSAWDPPLLDWLAEDFAAHNYDVRFLIRRIVTSRAYQLPAVNLDEQNSSRFVFQGPAVRRLSAEQFRDALTAITGVGYSSPAAEIAATESEKKRFSPPVNALWIWNDAQAADKAKAGHVYFRKRIQLAAVPSDAMAFVTCDNSFTLYVNGKIAGSGNDYKNGSLIDLRALLRVGENVFAIDAVNNLPDNTEPKTANPPAGTENPAGLLFYARLRQGQKMNDFVSDASWARSAEKQKNWEQPDFTPADWKPAVKLGEMGMAPWRISKEYLTTKFAAAYPGKVRASLVAADPLLVALGRPNREQVVTTRPSVATTLQALEMTNGETLTDILKRGAKALVADSSAAQGKLIPALYEKALGRLPTTTELKTAREMLGQPVDAAGVEDLLWAITMLPEFQLIY
jgi:mono/diheme cytochrome c family protein